MTVPDPVNAVNGMMQGPAGFGQGAIGSAVGQTQGPGLGIDRAALGGPNMDQQAQPPSGAPETGATAQNATRKPQGFFSFLGGIASAVAPIANIIAPGSGLALGALGAVATGIGGQQAQNQANAAAQAATGNETTLAGQIAAGPQLAPLIKAEQSGLSAAVDHSNAANPGKLLLDGMGQSFTDAIAGVASNKTNAENDAAGIYGNVAKAATTAATSQGNPWGPLGNILGGLTGGSGGSAAGAVSNTVGAAGIGDNVATLMSSQRKVGGPQAQPSGTPAAGGMAPPAAGGAPAAPAQPAPQSANRGGF